MYLLMLTHRLTGLLAACLLLCGCTTVPTAELGEYRAAFGEARTAGERFVIDYGVISERVDESIGAATPADPAARFGFDVGAVERGEGAADAVGVRLQAWEIVDRYNRALVALAEGRSEEEVRGALDGLVGSLKQFPIGGVAGLGSAVMPYIGLVQEALQIIDREMAARRFNSAVTLVGPKILGFVGLLKADASDFYEMRKIYRNRVYSGQTDRISDQLRAMAGLAASHGVSYPAGSGATPEQERGAAIIAGLDGAIRVLPEFVGGIPPIRAASSADAPGEPIIDSIESTRTAVADGVARALAADAELLAYRDAITEYVRLLVDLEQSIRALSVAAADGERSVPSLATVGASVRNLKRAWVEFEKTR